MREVIVVVSWVLIGWFCGGCQQLEGEGEGIVLPDSCFSVEVYDRRGENSDMLQQPWDRRFFVAMGRWRERKSGIVVKEYRFREFDGKAKKRYVVNSRWEVEFELIGPDSTWWQVVYGGKSREKSFYICWKNRAIDTVMGQPIYRFEVGWWTEWIASNIPAQYIRRLFANTEAEIVTYQPEWIRWPSLQWEKGIEFAVPGLVKMVEGIKQRKHSREGM